MRRASIVAVTTVALFAVGACVDLFHDTDFATLCTRTPEDPRCRGDASTRPDAAGRVDSATVDALAPPIDFCAWPAAEARVQAVRACAWLGACEGTIGDNAFGRCALQAQLAYDCTANPSLRPAGEANNLWSCLATVKTCGDVDRCVFPEGVESCAAGGEPGTFTGCGQLHSSVLIRCMSPAGGRAVGVEPCAMFGKTCAKESDSAASCSGSLRLACTTTGCAETSAADCNPDRPTFDQGIVCSNMGAGACASTDAGPSCTPNRGAPSCATTDAPSCDGTSVTSCVAGHEIRVDCAHLNAACDASVPPPAYDLAAACGPPEAPCVDDDRCSGRNLTSCGRGAAYEVQCESLGLGRCAEKNGRSTCTAPE